ncbi:MAG: ABC transporter ATP-binding protein [Acidobacteria bacterium]|nr:ABC transporter ATP-binding protein [Acidobacteriota bacterium]
MNASTAQARALAVRVENVAKSFPRRRPVQELARHPFRRPERVPALRGVTLELARGELVGLLGPNGAGKTTLIKILCGLVLPETGRAEILDVPVGSAALCRVVGLVHGDERSFYWRLTARENLSFFARLHHLPRSERRRRVDELLERVDLARDAERRFADFSSGMKQRLAIARALLADPPVLLMDEPTRSLDPVSAAHLREWIKGELHANGRKSILLATHNLREAETMCDRVVVIAGGLVQADGTPAELRRRGLSGAAYRVRLRGEPPAALTSAEVLARTDLPEGGIELVLRLASEELLDDALAELRSRGARIAHCAPEEQDLESVFHRLVEPRERP